MSAARDAPFDKIHFPNRIKEKALQRVAVVESAPSYAAFPCCRAVAASLTAIIRVADSHTSYLVPWIVEARVVTKRRASTRRARQMISVSCVQISLNVLWDNSERTIPVRFFLELVLAKRSVAFQLKMPRFFCASTLAPTLNTAT